MTVAARLRWALGAATLVGSFSSVCAAQVEDARQAAIRRTMIENAQRAQETGQFAQCAELAQRAVSIQDTGSLRRLLAECQLSAGMVVEAIGNAELCLSMLRRDERAVGRDVHIATCTRVVHDGRARSAQIVVHTPTTEPPNLRVLVGGQPLARVEWNIATLAAAGRLVIEATADGMQPFRRDVDVSSGALTEIRIELVPIVAQPSAGSTTTVSASGDGRPSATAVTASSNAAGATAVAPATAPRSRSQRGVSPLMVGGGVAAGVGVVGTVVGFAVPAALVAGFEARCGVGANNPSYESCHAEARAGQGGLDALSGVGVASIAVAGVGAALMVVGAVSRGSAEERARAVAVVPMFDRTTHGARVIVRW
jgi:hypothetical protein